ncbi:MAG: DUF4160 domain-containing protein [Lachnospiraceae bacterium]|nr:DUF4160 domain-containing protein [Lachnospiraceae bacterium]
MPKIFEYIGYFIYFWLNEQNEPIHVHVSKGKPTNNSTKIWILKDGIELADNKSNIKSNDLRKILVFINNNRQFIIEKWYEYFEYIKYYKK